MKKEIWKFVVGYEGLYEISNFGKIRSVNRIINHSSGGTRLYPGKILSPSTDKDGYLHIHLSKEGKLKYFRIHRLVYHAFKGELPKEIDHKDRNKLNNNIKNLRPATNSLNQGNREAPKNNLSGYKGIWQEKRTGKWRAAIQKDNKRQWLGSFNNIEEAVAVYNKKALELFGDYAL